MYFHYSLGVKGLATYGDGMLNEMRLNAGDAVREYRDALAKLDGMDLVAPYLVQCEGIPVTFDIDGDGEVVRVRPCRPHLARSFMWIDAERLAGVIRNGNGVRGQVVHIRYAIRSALDAQLEVLRLLNEIGQQQYEQMVASTCRWIDV